jgi:hypothetical protein
MAILLSSRRAAIQMAGLNVAAKPCVSGLNTSWQRLHIDGGAVFDILRRTTGPG